MISLRRARRGARRLSQCRWKTRKRRRRWMAMRRKRRKKQGMQLIRESRRGGRRRKHVGVEKEHIVNVISVI